MYRSLAILAVSSLLAAPAFAAGSCSKAPSSQFQPISTLKAKLAAQGIDVRRVKTESGCYEVYGFDKKGEKVNLGFNAKTFAVVSNAEAGEN